MEIQGTQNNQNNLEKEKTERFRLSDLKTYYKAIVIKKCGTGIRIETDQQNRSME